MLKVLLREQSKLIPSSFATTRRDFRPFPCSNAVPIEAKKYRLVLKSRIVATDEDGKGVRPKASSVRYSHIHYSQKAEFYSYII